MSSLSSAKRKLNAQKVWIAQEVQRRKIEIARKFVEDRIKTDKEFAQDVLNAVGENLPPEIKKAAEETVSKETLPSEEDPSVTVKELEEALVKHGREPAKPTGKRYDSVEKFDAGLIECPETFVQSDGGGMIPMNETELSDYPKDGPNSAINYENS